MRAEAFLEESTDNEPVQKLGSAEAFLTASDPEPATTSTEPAPSMNMGRGAVERGGQLLGGLFTAGNAMAEQAEQEYPLGGLVWEDGLIPDYKNPKEYQRWRAEQGGDEPLKAAADYWANFDAGYVPEHTWESVKQEFGEGGALSGSAWGEVLAYGAEQGVKSIPDMFAAMANLPGYVMARSGEIGEERARNKGKEGAELVDVAEAAPFALGSAILERMGASGITQAGAETLGKEALKAGIGKMAKEGAKAGAKEAGTEFLQEGIIEYLGEKLGTDAAMSVWEALDRGAAGAVAGGVYGTTAGTAGAAVNEVRNRRQGEAAPDEVAPPILNDEVVDEPAAASESEGDVLPSDDNAPSTDYPGRPEWADNQTNIFRDGTRPEGEIVEQESTAPEAQGSDSQVVQSAEDFLSEPAPTAEEVVADESVAPEPAQEPAVPESTDATGKQASWVIRNKETGEVIAETFERNTVAALNESKYEAVPISEHLASINQQTAESTPQMQTEAAPVVATPEAVQPQELTPAEAVDVAASDTNIEPTEAQKEAGNYKKGRVKVHGLDIAIENPKGSTRSGTDPNGNRWENTMAHHYGYLNRTEGADGDHVDVFIGPDPESDRVFVVDQQNADGTFDEHKVLLGFKNQAEARKGYRDNYDKGWKVGPVKRLSMDEFKDWLKNGDTKKPLQPEKAKAIPATKARKKAAAKVPDNAPVNQGAATEDRKALAEVWRQIGREYPDVDYGAVGNRNLGVMKRVKEATGREIYGPEMKAIFPQSDREAAFREGQGEGRASEQTENSDAPSLSWKKDGKRLWRSDDGQIIADLSFTNGGIRTKLFAVFANDAARDKGDNYASGETLTEAKGKAVAQDSAANDQGTDESGKQAMLSRESYRRTPGFMDDALTVDEARQISGQLMKGWKGAPDVIIRNDIGQFPPALQAIILAKGAEHNMRGVFWNDTAYLLASRIPDRMRMEQVLLHEVVGHYGLRKMLGKDLEPVLNQIWAAHGGKTRADFIIRRYFPDGSFDANNKEHRHEIAEELIAHLAEQNRGQTLVERAVAIIRRGLRKLGFTIEFTVEDIVDLLRRARRTVENGGFETDSSAEGAPVVASKFSKAGKAGSDRAPWPADFPKVPFASALGSAEKHPQYKAAKSGDADAAMDLVDDLVTDEAIGRIRAMIGDRKPALVPVMAEEASGHNAIPAAYAVKIAHELGLEVYGDIVQSVRAKRTGTGADYRLANHSAFDGPVEAGKDYLVVDDTMTMGGTLAGLRGHIEANGGSVVGATTLTGFQKEGQLALTEKMRQDLWRKHGEPLDEYLHQEFGYGIDSLTQGEAGHFRKAVSLDAIRDRITAASVADNDQQNDGQEDSQGVVPPGARFSRDDVPDLDPEPFGAPSDTLLRKMISKIADKFTVLKGVQQNITDRFGEIQEDADAYLAEELFHGKVENDIRLIQENMIQPLAEKMSEYDVSLAQLDEFLYAKHAPERNRVIAQRNDQFPDGGSGMTNAEAAAVIDQVEKSGKLDQFQELADSVYQMLERRRKILKDAGLLDEETLGAWEASYRHYVPLKGWAADEKQEAMPKIGKGFAIAGKESQMAGGRKSKASSPVANAISDLSEAVLRQRKNEVGNAFLSLVQSYPNDGYWRVYTAENPEVERKAVKRVDPTTGKTVVRVEEQTVPMAMMSDRYFTTKVNGETYYIKLQDQRLMNAMRNIGPENNGLLVRSLSMVTRLMSSLNTSYNPEFVISNFSRDIQTALLNLTSEQSADDGKVRGERIAAKTLKSVPTAIRAINASLKGKPLNGRAGDWQRHFDQFRKDGAKTGWFDMKDVDGQMKDLETMISMAGGRTLSLRGLRRGFNAITDWVENTNSAIENGVRLSAYVNAIEAGIPRAKAASLAKNMTVNFNRKGELGTMMNALYMFANASVQGTANFVRTLGRLNGVKGDPVWRRLNTAQKIAAGMAVGGFMLSALNRLVAGDDDDGVNWWDKVPDYVKERNIVIMKSLVGGEPGEYWTIPLPYGYNIFPVIGTGMEHMLASDKPAGDIASNIVLAGLGSFSPIGFEQSEEVYGILFKNITPTILRPGASIMMNENFMGGPIYRRSPAYSTPKPDSALSFRSTPEVYKSLAETINEATGGSAFRSGAMDFSPDVMHFLVGYYGGGAYNFFTSRAPNAALKWAQGVELEDREIPFYRKLHGKVLRFDDESKFYDRRDEINQLADERDNLRGRERVEFVKEYRDKIRLKGTMESVEKRLKLLRAQRDRVEAMDLSAAETDKRLQHIEKQMKRAIDQFNKRYNESED
jgi:hypothetical protein